MRTAEGPDAVKIDERGVHTFTLVLDGVQEIDEALETAVFEAGCDDALLGTRHAVAFLEFDRQAATLPEAVLDAIRQVETVSGIRVVRVEPDDLVTASEIARRLKRSRESIRLLASGLRGAGDFPSPVHGLRGRSPLWRWTDVATWMRAHEGASTVGERELEAATFIAVINSALHMRQFAPAMSTVRAIWMAIGGRTRAGATDAFGWTKAIRAAREDASTRGS